MARRQALAAHPITICSRVAGGGGTLTAPARAERAQGKRKQHSQSRSFSLATVKELVSGLGDWFATFGLDPAELDARFNQQNQIWDLGWLPGLRSF